VGGSQYPGYIPLFGQMLMKHFQEQGSTSKLGDIVPMSRDNTNSKFEKKVGDLCVKRRTG
jgi:hypothetical protein